MRFQKVMLCLLLCLTMVKSHAAFPVKVIKQVQVSAIAANTAGIPAAIIPARSFLPRLFSHWQGDGVAARPRHKVVIRSRTMASLLCGLFIFPFTYYCFGVHRLYLGYTWQGLLQMTMPYIGFAAAALLLSSFATISIAGAIGIITLAAVMAVGALVWQISDYSRIRSGRLQPKWGYYRDDVKRVRRND